MSEIEQSRAGATLPDAYLTEREFSERFKVPTRTRSAGAPRAMARRMSGSGRGASATA